MVVPGFLEKAFNSDYHDHDSKGDRYSFYTVSLGSLTLTDGRLIACDPFWYDNHKPAFAAVFPAGDFPVELAIARIRDDERVAFARINFSPATPVRWEIAAPEGEDPDSLEPGEIFGFPVDSGTGCFIDTHSAVEFLKFIKNDDAAYVDVMSRDLSENNENTRSWLFWQREGWNIAIFSSGWGDGFYASYIAYDADGKICRFVTDFNILDWPDPSKSSLRIV